MKKVIKLSRFCFPKLLFEGAPEVSTSDPRGSALVSSFSFEFLSFAKINFRKCCWFSVILSKIATY